MRTPLGSTACSMIDLYGHQCITLFLHAWVCEIVSVVCLCKVINGCVCKVINVGIRRMLNTQTILVLKQRVAALAPFAEKVPLCDGDCEGGCLALALNLA